MSGSDKAQRPVLAGEKFPANLFWLTAVLVAAIGLVGWMVLEREKAVLRTVAETTLTSVADLKAHQLESWTKERLGDAALVRASLLLSDYLAKPQDPALQAGVQEYFQNLRKAYNYSVIAVFDARGTLLHTTDTNRLEQYHCDDRRVQAALLARDIEFVDLHQARPGDPIHLSLLCPIRLNPRAEGPADGVVMLMMDPNEFVYPFIKSWPGPSETAETLLVKRDGNDVLCLNETRHRSGTALNLRLPLSQTNVPAVQAVLGKKGLVTGVDYRGVPVTATIRTIRGTPWLMIAKLDEAELEASLRQTAWRAAGFFGALSVVVVLGFAVFWRQQKFVFLQRELAERKAAEASIQERETQLRALGDNLPGGILYQMLLEPNGQYHYTYVSAGVERLLGISPEQAKADVQALWNIIVESDLERVTAARAKSFAELSVFDCEFRLRAVAGSILWLRVRAHPRRLPNGSVLWDGVATDITARKHAEAAAREEAVLNQTVVASAPGTFYMLDSAGRYVRWNDYQRDQIVGRPEAEMAGAPALETIHPDDRALVQERIINVLRDGREEVVEGRVLLRGGPEFRWLLMTGRRVMIQNQPYLVGFGIDLTERRRAELARRQSEEKYRGIFDESVAAIYVFDREKRFVDANQAGLDLLGYTREELLRLSIPDVDADPVVVQPAHQELLAGGRLINYEHRLRRKDGRVITVLNNSRALTDEHGEVVGMQSTLFDITQRQQAEAALHKREEIYSALVGQAGDSIVLMDGVTYRFVEFNQVAHESLGYTREEFAQLTPADIQAEHTPEEVRQNTQKVLEEGSLVFDSRHRCRDGSVRDVRVSLRRLQIQGRPFLTAIWVDITERRRAEQALRDSELHRRLAIDAARMGTWDWDLQTNQLQWSSIHESLWGYAPGAFPGTLEAFTAPIPPEDLRRLWQVVEQAKQTHTPFQCEYRVCPSPGVVHWVSSHGQYLFDAQGQPVRVVGVVYDITERRRVEHALQEGLLFRREAEKIGRIGAWKVSPATDYLYWTEGVYEIVEAPLDYKPGLQEGLKLYDAESRPALQFALQTALQQGTPFCIEIGLTTMTGRHLWTEVRGLGRMEENGQAFVMGTFQDVTARHQAEEALAENRERLRMALNAAHMGVWEYNFATDKLYWSPEIFANLGVPPIEPSRERMLALLHPEDVHISGEAMAKAIAEHGLYHCEYRALVGDRTIWVEDRGRIIRDEQDRPIKVVGTAHDVTDRKRLEDQFRQAQKLEAVGQLAGGIAHDFNNIIAAFMMNLDLLKLDEQFDVETRQVLQELSVEAHRAAALTRQLLMFSRRSVLAVQPVNLNELVGNLLKMLGRLIGEHIKLICETKTGAFPMVEADSGMLEQVLVNLAVNARDAMPKGGCLTISNAVETFSPEAAGLHPSRRPGTFVCLAVKDTGTGMDAATLKRIFEPFFTTKEVGKGTGLGLATVYGIVAQHKGWVEVQSAPGAGSTFRVLLPALAPSTAQASQVSQASSAEPIRRGHETILLVEDETTVRQAVGRALRLLGYRVFDAENGHAALRLWQAHGEQIDLLLTDMVMPEGMTGLELAEKLQAAQPDLKIIISSGYSAEFVQNSIRSRPGFVYFPKPYDLKPLTDTLRRCLEN